MCGIVGYWARESVLTHQDYDALFSSAETRGKDGVGVCIYSQHNNQFLVYKSSKPYSQVKDEVLDFIDSHMDIGDVLIGICRAVPETEINTSEEDLDNTMQPIVYPDIALVHNGAISEFTREWLEKKGFTQKTQIDSERIILAYLAFKKNWKKMMKVIIGGFAFLMIDKSQNSLYIGVNHMPLSHGYIKGLGYLVASYTKPIKQILYAYYASPVCTCNVWEAWYYCDVEPFTIRRIDLDSGMISKHQFQPNYVLPGGKTTLEILGEGVE